MPHTRAQKAAFVEHIRGQLEASPAIYLTNCSGLTVAQVDTLRNQFRNAGVSLQVVKNTLLKRAMDDLGGYEELFETLHGPTAVAFAEEPSAPARVMKGFLKDSKLELPELKGAYIDGAIFGAGALETLASLKSKDELIGDIIGLLLSPMTNVVGALQAPGSTLVGALQTIAEGEDN